MAILLSLAILLGVAATGTNNTTDLGFDSSLVDWGKNNKINPDLFKPLDPNLFQGIDSSGIDLSRIHTIPKLLRDRPL